jgi:hypothetical protein
MRDIHILDFAYQPRLVNNSLRLTRFIGDDNHRHAAFNEERHGISDREVFVNHDHAPVQHRTGRSSGRLGGCTRRALDATISAWFGGVDADADRTDAANIDRHRMTALVAVDAEFESSTTVGPDCLLG